MTNKTNKTNKKEYAFDEVKHIHTLGDKALTGVTTVLGIVSKGDGLIQWSANEAVKWLQEHPNDWENAKKAWTKARNKAGDSGKDTHAIIESLIKHGIESNDGYISGNFYSDTVDLENKQVFNFVQWATTNKVKFLESEKNIWSETLWIGGIVDFVCEINGEIFVGDIKTSKEIYPTMYWQTSAYQLCLQELGLYDNIKGFKIVRLGKDGSFEVGTNYAYEDNIDGFKSALNVYRKLNLIS